MERITHRPFRTKIIAHCWYTYCFHLVELLILLSYAHAFRENYHLNSLIENIARPQRHCISLHLFCFFSNSFIVFFSVRFCFVNERMAVDKHTPENRNRRACEWKISITQKSEYVSNMERVTFGNFMRLKSWVLNGDNGVSHFILFSFENTRMRAANKWIGRLCSIWLSNYRFLPHIFFFY